MGTDPVWGSGMSISKGLELSSVPLGGRVFSWHVFPFLSWHGKGNWAFPGVWMVQMVWCPYQWKWQRICVKGKKLCWWEALARNTGAEGLKDCFNPWSKFWRSTGGQTQQHSSCISHGLSTQPWKQQTSFSQIWLKGWKICVSQERERLLFLRWLRYFEFVATFFWSKIHDLKN